jgi:membrane protease YdiL (CAAX protease family)
MDAQLLTTKLHIPPTRPSLVARPLLLQRLDEGLRDLFARFGRWRVGVRWYATALLIAPLVGLVTLVAERVLQMPTATLDEMMGTLPVSAIYPIFAALGEEFGWRGFYLPRLQQRRSALGASTIVGVAWGLWHIPTQILAFRQSGWLP